MTKKRGVVPATLAIILAMALALYFSPPLYAISLATVAVIAIFCLPVLLVAQMVRTWVAHRLKRLLLTPLLTALLYALVYRLMFNAPAGTHVFDDIVVAPLWLPALLGAAVGFVIALLVELLSPPYSPQAQSQNV